MNTEKQKTGTAAGLPEQLRRLLAGKRILLGGLENELRREVLVQLEGLKRQGKLDIAVIPELEKAGAGDYVLLFCGMEAAGTEGFRQLDRLMEQMETLAESGLKSVALVSDSRVYGKRFGVQSPCREEECGYVCHTSSDETGLQCMRLAEHLACRLAGEKRLAVKVARASFEEDISGAGAAAVTTIAALCVLAYGTDGEIYNLPGKSDTGSPAEEKARQNDRPEGKSRPAEEKARQGVCSGERTCPDRPEGPLAWPEERSPLSPMKTEMNTDKFAALFRSVC